MRTALIVPLFLSWIAGAASAQTASPPPALEPPDTAAPSATSRGDAARKARATPEGAATNALESCLAMWDRGTHMTRRQWARACRRVADRLKGTTLE